MKQSFDMEGLTLRALKTILEQTEGNTHLFPEAADRRKLLGCLEDPRCRTLWNEVREAGAQYRSMQMEPLLYSEFTLFHKTGDRTQYDHKYFDRRRRLSVMTLLYLADGDERWLRELEDVIWAICDEYTWVIPAHVGLYHNRYPEGIWDQPAPPRETVDLFAGETAFALAEITQVLEGRLQPWVVHRVHAEIERRVFRVFFDDPVPQNWEMKINNWPAVCAASIGGAALWLVKEPERLAGMLWRVLASLKQHLSGFDAEGATPEGTAYWQFGFGYYVYFAELLAARTGGSIQLLDGEKLRRIALFPGAGMLTGNQVVNFSDAPPVIDYYSGLYCKLRSRFPEMKVPDQQPVFGDAFRCWIMASRMVLWLGEASEPSEDKDNEEAVVDGTRFDTEDHFFREHGWVISKTLSPQGIVAFAAKGGSNDEPHNHNDLGHFIVHAHGSSVLCDLGAGEYTRQYFQPAHRYRMLTAGSQGHSVPVINGMHQQFGKHYQAQVLRYEASQEQILYELDLTKAYDGAGLCLLHRQWIWDRSAGKHSLTMNDVIEWSGKPVSFREVFICSVRPEPIQAGYIRIGPLEMHYEASRLHCTLEEAAYRTIGGVEQTAYRLILDLHEPSAKEQVKVQFTVNV
ncbi:heparinase II/III family protein [Paenibacillus periandrae]|uniref:heparinase II/III family protein n=1 Tax=Paenibacillus periandrae TaxID=1761741 RepID=UPI001F08E1DA|nr:heparinase II/III family protein [Paenibacillus periandrae]